MSMKRHGGMLLVGETEELGENPVLLPLRTPQILHGQTRGRTQAFAVRVQRLTA